MTKKRRILLHIYLGLLLICILTGCGLGYSPVGSWYTEENEDLTVNIQKGGKLLIYDSYWDECYSGAWRLEDKKVILSFEEYGETTELTLTPDGKTILQEEDMLLTKGESVELPFFTISTLNDGTWIDDKKNVEMEFYSDGSWDTYNTETWETISKGSYIIDGNKVILTYENNVKLSVTMSENLKQLTTKDGDVYQLEE